MRAGTKPTPFAAVSPVAGMCLAHSKCPINLVEQLSEWMNGQFHFKKVKERNTRGTQRAHRKTLAMGKCFVKLEASREMVGGGQAGEKNSNFRNEKGFAAAC